MAEKGTCANPIVAVYIDDIQATDPDSMQPVDLEVWKDPVSGGMFAIDASFVAQVDEVIVSPFNSHIYLSLPEPVIELTAEGYVEDAGMTCPACRAAEAVESAGQFEVSDRTATQQVRCLFCGATWVDVYRLTGFDSLERGATDGGEEAKEEEEEDQGDLT